MSLPTLLIVNFSNETKKKLIDLEKKTQLANEQLSRNFTTDLNRTKRIFKGRVDEKLLDLNQTILRIVNEEKKEINNLKNGFTNYKNILTGDVLEIKQNISNITENILDVIKEKEKEKREKEEREERKRLKGIIVSLYGNGRLRVSLRSDKSERRHLLQRKCLCYEFCGKNWRGKSYNYHRSVNNTYTSDL